MIYYVFTPNAVTTSLSKLNIFQCIGMKQYTLLSYHILHYIISSHQPFIHLTLNN